MAFLKILESPDLIVRLRDGRDPRTFFFFLTFPTHLAFDVQSGLGITFHSHHVPSSSDCKQESSYIRPNEYLMEWGV